MRNVADHRNTIRADWICAATCWAWVAVFGDPDEDDLPSGTPGPAAVPCNGWLTTRSSTTTLQTVSCPATRILPCPDPRACRDRRADPPGVSAVKAARIIVPYPVVMPGCDQRLLRTGLLCGPGMAASWVDTREMRGWA
jgi:hypothetical protein